MQHAALAIILSGLGREIGTLAVSVILAILLTFAFVIASLGAISGGGHMVASEGAPGGSPTGTVEMASTQVGVPYVWGGGTPGSGFDCSGLVQWVYGRLGVSLPRTAQTQFDATARIPPGSLQPGDLVFFEICCQPPDRVTHVGIYIGNGEMIHAPAPGERVRRESIRTPYWQGHWAGAGRPHAKRFGQMAIEQGGLTDGSRQ